MTSTFARFNIDLPKIRQILRTKSEGRSELLAAHFVGSMLEIGVNPYTNTPPIRRMILRAGQDQAPERISWLAEYLSNGQRMELEYAVTWLEGWIVGLEVEQRSA